MFVLSLFILVSSRAGSIAAKDVVQESDGFRPQIVRRTLRSVSDPSLDFLFDTFGSDNGINRTQLSHLMNEIGVRDTVVKSLRQSSKVRIREQENCLGLCSSWYK